MAPNSMAIWDLFSKRQKSLRSKVPDVYLYDSLPNRFRVQVIHIINDVTGKQYNYGPHGRLEVFREIHEILLREYGLFRLTDDGNDADAIFNFFLSLENVNQAVDIIELLFLKIDTSVRRNPEYFVESSLSPNEAIDDLNHRFREHGIGYEFASGQIIRIDSKVIHQEIIKPALLFLQNPKFKGANQEFLSAHSHYRAGTNKECLNDCLKAFESTIKVICAKRKWSFKPTDTVKSLIDILFREELIPSFLQAHFTGLRTTLESGTPTVRNKLGGHGQGTQLVEVPEYIASYALHLTATNILLLAKADAEKK